MSEAFERTAIERYKQQEAATRGNIPGSRGGGFIPMNEQGDPGKLAYLKNANWEGRYSHGHSVQGFKVEASLCPGCLFPDALEGKWPHVKDGRCNRWRANLCSSCGATQSIVCVDGKGFCYACHERIFCCPGCLYPDSPEGKWPHTYDARCKRIEPRCVMCGERKFGLVEVEHKQTGERALACYRCLKDVLVCQWADILGVEPVL